MTTGRNHPDSGNHKIGKMLAAAVLTLLLMLAGCAGNDAIAENASEQADNTVGAVASLTLYAADNEGIPYDIKARQDSENKVFYFFLPSTANLSDIRVRAAQADGGAETDVLSLNFEECEYCVQCADGNEPYEIKAMQSKIPAVFIEINEADGEISSMNGDPAHKTRCYGDMTVVVPEDLAAEKGWKTEYVSRENDPDSPGTMYMRGRGNWTWEQAKRPYQIHLEKGENLLGMGKDKTWILLANVLDASLLRNQLFYNLAADMGMTYSPKIEPVDVFLNGDYLGSYSLTEKVQIDEDRVNIDEDKDFLIELDHYYMKEIYTFATNSGLYFTLHNQENDDGVSRIQQIVNRIEEKFYNEESDAYLDNIDLDSWVRYWWLQDVSHNNDAFVGSNYFYYVSDEDTLYAGPVWDMDNTLGISGDGENLQTFGWHSANRGWFKCLYDHESFRNALMDYYRSTLAELIFALPQKIDEYAAYIRESAEMNYIINDRNDYVNSGTKSWDEDVGYLKDFLNKRLDWYRQNLG